MPGTVRGLALAHKKFGKLPWKDVVAAGRRARRGGLHVIDGCWPASLEPRARPTPKTTNAEFQRVFGKPGGAKWKAGDRLVQPDLADAAADRREGRRRLLHRRPADLIARR